MVFRRGSRTADIQPGAMFRRVGPNNAEELVRVLTVAKDGSGIPHVQYAATVRRADGGIRRDERRTIALSLFTRMFPERVAG